MDKEYDRHYSVKGDSWRDMALDDLKALLYNVYEKFQNTNDDSKEEYAELIDLADVILMLGEKLIVENV